MTKRKICPKCGVRALIRGSKTKAGKTRWRCQEPNGERSICYQTTNPDAPYRGRNKVKDAETKQEFKRSMRGRKRIVVTWAQNATPVHTGFLSSLQAYCKENDAELVVIPGRYKNVTSMWEESQVNAQWWAPELVPFLCNQRKRLNKNLVLVGDVSTQPTAVSPLTGFEALTHGESMILGHPKLQMKCVPTPHQKLPKMMTTTGAVTVQNYSDTKAGKKGEFHHVLGAVVIELDGGYFHMRHLNARKDGAFCDMEKAYHPDGKVRKAGPYQALVFGDFHYRFADPQVIKATFGKGGLVDKLDPKVLVWHDLLDSYAVNVHHPAHPFIGVAKRKARFDNIKEEVVQTVEGMAALGADRHNVIVPSNHDNMLYRWLEKEDWKMDPENAEFYLETALQVVRSAHIDEHGTTTLDPFQYWVERLTNNAKNIECARGSYNIDGIELSLHGDRGPNGARGSIKGFSTIGVKSITGHGHSPAIEGGHYRTGTSTRLKLEYTGPVGSWLNTHCSIDPMGKRHLHTMVNGGFCL